MAITSVFRHLIHFLFSTSLRSMLGLYMDEWVTGHGFNTNLSHYYVIQSTFIEFLLYARVCGTTKINKTWSLSSWTTETKLQTRPYKMLGDLRGSHNFLERSGSFLSE